MFLGSNSLLGSLEPVNLLGAVMYRDSSVKGACSCEFAQLGAQRARAELMGRKRRTLDPKLDIVFWMLFGAERNRELLISLLNAVLRPAAPIDEVEVLPAQPEGESPDDKGIVLDVRVRLDSGEQIDVEMQSQRHPALRERALYYWARLYSGQLPRGSDYTRLRRCAVILVANFRELAGPRFHSTFCPRELESGELLTEHLSIHVLELPKLGGPADGNDEPGLLDWGKFLSARNDEELEDLAMQSPVMKQAKEALEQISADPEARVLAERREMALISYELGLGTARREGREEGREEGRRVLREVLEALLSARFSAVPDWARRRTAGATLQQLKDWCAGVPSAASVEEVLGPADEAAP